MKRLLIVCFIALAIKSYGQQEFKVSYLFKNSKFLAANLRLVDPTSPDVVRGYVLQPNGSKYPIHQFTPTLTPKAIYNKLKGVIDFRDGDMLYLHFWFITDTSSAINATTYVTAADSNNSFAYIINWDKDKFKIPFYYRFFTATNIPFKYDFTAKTTTADFLDLNVAYLWVRGRTKIFKNNDLRPRNLFVGIGPYVGFTSLEDTSQTLKQFGITYGASTVVSFYGLNLVESFGFENGFTSQTSNPHFYIGIGIGFNLIPFVDPSNQQ